MVGRLLVLVAAAVVATAAAGAAFARTAYDDRVVGVEVPPISPSLGTFVGLAAGELPGRFRVQIAHEPLAGGRPVAITGGTFSLRTWSRTLSGAVTGGSVSVVSPGARCADQVYAVSAQLSSGSFSGRLTHHRRSLLGRCVVYAATISGSATFAG